MNFFVIALSKVVMRTIKFTYCFIIVVFISSLSIGGSVEFEQNDINFSKAGELSQVKNYLEENLLSSSDNSSTCCLQIQNQLSFIFLSQITAIIPADPDHKSRSFRITCKFQV